MSDSEDDLFIDLNEENFNYKNADVDIPSTSSKPNKLDVTDDDLTTEMEPLGGDISDDSEDSNTDFGDICAICLGHIKGEIGFPDVADCEHYFCLLCILEWAKTNPVCPQDRRSFENVLVRDSVKGEVKSSIPTFKAEPEEEELLADNPTYCEVCGSSEREDCLLLCDGCDLGYHLECLTPPLSEVPIEEWFCPLCVAADLPTVVSQTTLKDTEPVSKKAPTKVKKKKSGSYRSRTRMIPRTRATERVLQRISLSRKEEKVRYKKKSVKKSSKKEAEGEKEGKGTVQAFKKARPFGGITDDDIDAAFNSDDYAEKLLSSCSSEINSKFKKELAVRKLQISDSVPLPSYIGRANHPKLENCSSSTSTDLLINILEEQDVLLSKSKDISLTKERKLTKKEGSKPLNFNVDRENRIMSDLLPSQKKALGNEDKSVAEEKSPKRKNDYENHKRNSSNGYSDYKYDSSYKSSSDRRRHPYSPSERSRKHSSHYYRDRSRDRHDDRSRYRSSRNRDSHRYRDRSKSDDAKDYGSVNERYSHRSRDGRRNEHSHKRSSRTPERRYSKERNDRRKSSSLKSFWGSSYNDDRETNIRSANYDQSLHTFNVKNSDHSSVGKKNEKSNELRHSSGHSENRDQISIQETKSEDLLNFQDDSLISESLSEISEDKSILKNKEKDVYQSPAKESKSEKLGIMSEIKHNENDESTKAVNSEATKEKFKSLFGEDYSDPESFAEEEGHHRTKSSSSDNFKKDCLNGRKHHKRKISSPEVSEKRSPKRTVTEPISPERTVKDTSVENKEENFVSPVKDDKLILEEDQFNSNEDSLSNSIQEIDGSTVSEPYSPTSSPNMIFGIPEEEIGDITTLSQSSRDLIFKSLFSRKRFPAADDDSDNSLDYNENSNGKMNVESIDEISDSALSKLELERSLNAKVADEEKGETLLSTSIGSEKKTSHLKSKNKYNTLFGDSIHSDTSESESEHIPHPENSSAKSQSTKAVNSISYSSNSKKGTEEFKVPKPDLASGISTGEGINKKDDVLKTSSKAIPTEDALEKDRQKKPKDGIVTNGNEAKNLPSPSKIKLNKLHLETKVVDEAKKFLNPYYLEKGFSKEIYKEIISKCVSKVLEVECSTTIDPRKIQKLVDGYVQVYMHRNKKNQMGKSAG